MSSDKELLINSTYCNPVLTESFPDPFVLKYCGEYFAYCTGKRSDGSAFSIIHSKDLVNWMPVGGAMEINADEHPHYWAPEVTHHNGKFYLYYSTGNETLMEIRVAVSDRPDGGFVDSGKRMTTEDFAIDAHVFTDDSGERYMFYATDFLDHTHIGTGTVVDRMTDWFTLAGDPRPVTRPRYDWQVYDPNRLEKGGVRWHTVEGPFVLKRKGIYYELFSGGNWKDPSYGVSFAEAKEIIQGDEWDQFSDGMNVLPILGTIPDKVIGPGHNSVISGPNNRENFCVYHSWTDNGRTLAIDRLDFAGNRIFIKGPTYTPQPLPFLPTVSFAHFEFWKGSAGWSISENTARNNSSNHCELTTETGHNGFLAEVNFRSLENVDKDAAFTLRLENETDKCIEYIFSFEKKTLTIMLDANGSVNSTDQALPDDLDSEVFHHMRLEANGRSLQFSFDEKLLQIGSVIDKDISRLSLVATNTDLELKGFALTKGFEDLFDHSTDEIKDISWKAIGENAKLSIKDNELVIFGAEDDDAIVVKGAPAHNYEFIANIRSLGSMESEQRFGFAILDSDLEPMKKLFITAKGNDHFLSYDTGDVELPLPKHYLPESITQFRFVKIGQLLTIESENDLLGEIQLDPGESLTGIICRNCSVGIEMARFTVL